MTACERRTSPATSGTGRKRKSGEENIAKRRLITKLYETKVSGANQAICPAGIWRGGISRLPSLIEGLLSPTLSSGGGEGEETSAQPDLCGVSRCTHLTRVHPDATTE